MWQLSLALRAVSAIFVLGPTVLLQIWPSGFEWDPGHAEYEQMIAAVYAVLGVFLWRAAADPAANASLIWFAVWSSVAHAGVMALHGFSHHERTHLVGDVPALLLVAAALSFLMLRSAGSPRGMGRTDPDLHVSVTGRGQFAMTDDPYSPEH